MTAVPA